MKVQEIMERAGISQTGRAIAYIKDGLEEIEMHTKQNVVRGALASVSSNQTTITTWGQQSANNYLIHPITGAYSLGTLNAPIYNKISFSGASGSDPANSLTAYEYSGLASATYTIENSNELRITSPSIGGTAGIIATLSGLTVGKSYTIHLDWIVESGVTAYAMVSTTYGVDQSSYNINTTPNTIIRALSAAGTPTTTIGEIPVDSSDQVSNNRLINTKSDGYSDHYLNFKAESETQYLYVIVLTANKYIQIDELQVYPTIWELSNTNAIFSNFKENMKITLEGSSYNDSSISTNTSTGYYTALGPSSDGTKLYFNFSESLNRAEVPGNTITVRGQTINYMDIIKDKRFYPLPDDMLKLVDVKVKNHKNGNDKYKSVERMIYEPSEQDGDNV